MNEFFNELIEKLKKLPHAESDMWIWLCDAEITIREFAEEYKDCSKCSKSWYQKGYDDARKDFIQDGNFPKAYVDQVIWERSIAIKQLEELGYELGQKVGWIPCEEKMPKTETEVLILAKRKYCGGEVKHIITTAMYEDGTVLENDSCWVWQDIEGEWDEENDCYIIPEGWWENRHYNPDEVYNNVVDDEVIAWQPLPQPYKAGDEND